MQNVFTIGKLSAMFIIIVGGLVNLSKGNLHAALVEMKNLKDVICSGSTTYLDLGFAGSTTSFSEISQAFYGGLWAYDGW